MAKPLTIISSKAVPILRDNIDTDAIIPSREIKGVTKTGLADGLFAGWRYDTGREINSDFLLNWPQFQRCANIAERRKFRLWVVARASRMGAS